MPKGCGSLAGWWEGCDLSTDAMVKFEERTPRVVITGWPPRVVITGWPLRVVITGWPPRVVITGWPPRVVITGWPPRVVITGCPAGHHQGLWA